MDAFKAARLLSPFKFHELKPSATDIDCLKAFQFLSSQETTDGLKMEIPMYMAAGEDVSTEINPIAWWRRHAIELPKWVHAFKKVLLVQPSEGIFQFYKDLLRNRINRKPNGLKKAKG